MDRLNETLMTVMKSSANHIDSSELSRRSLLRLGLVSAAGLAMSGGFSTRRVLASEGHGMEPGGALKKLMEGNTRYVEGKTHHPNQSADRMGEVAKGQHPFAVILGCADSRVPPEIIFDQGLGDLFVLRVAGNIADDAVIGSIEYAVEHLGSTLVFVLGHERCGAVAAAVDVVTKSAKVPGHIGSLTQAIKPAVEKVKGQAGDLVDNAVRANVSLVASQLAASKPILAELVKAGKIKIAGGRYDLDQGKVELV